MGWLIFDGLALSSVELFVSSGLDILDILFLCVTLCVDELTTISAMRGGKLQTQLGMEHVVSRILFPVLL